MGLYSGTVQDQYHPLIRPQENRNKTDVRWVTLNLDYRQMGVGGDTSWGDRARLRPFSPRDDKPVDLTRTVFATVDHR